MGLFDFLRGKPAPIPVPKQAVPAPEGGWFAPDRARMFDLAATQRLANLFSVPATLRDSAWIDDFFRTAWNAAITVPEPPHFDGPDGLPYYRFDLPRAGAPFDAQCLANLARTCVDRNAGAVFFAGPDDSPEQPQYVVAMGVIDSLLRFGSPDGDPVDLGESGEYGPANGSVTMEAGQQVLTGTPSPDYLPPHAARALHRYMTRIWGMEEPRVQLLVNAAMRPSRSLMIGRRHSQFASSEEAALEMQRLLWFFPPRRSLVLMPDDWDEASMTRLTDLFD